jgi:hypothetical protein
MSQLYEMPLTRCHCQLYNTATDLVSIQHLRYHLYPCPYQWYLIRHPWYFFPIYDSHLNVMSLSSSLKDYLKVNVTVVIYDNDFIAIWHTHWHLTLSLSSGIALNAKWWSWYLLQLSWHCSPIACSSAVVENCKNHFNLSPELLLFPQILLQLPANDK